MSKYLTSSDCELLAFLNGGSEPAFNEIYKRYAAGVFLTARNRTNNDLDAEEILQDIFCNLWRMRATINVEKGLKTYLAVAVKYSVINRAVKQRRDNRFIEKFAQRTSHFDLSTQETIRFNELEKNLMESISLLPERCQLVFRLRFERDYSQKQIAAEMNISEKTVEAHLSKARKHIRTSLGSTLGVCIVSILDAIIK